jgi:hypothetical protein
MFDAALATTSANRLGIFNQNQAGYRSKRPCLVCIRGTRRNEYTGSLRIRNDIASKVDFQDTGQNEANVPFRAPVRLDKLCGELDEPKLLRAVSVDLEAHARQRRLPIERFKLYFERMQSSSP